MHGYETLSIPVTLTNFMILIEYIFYIQDCFSGILSYGVVLGTDRSYLYRIFLQENKAMTLHSRSFLPLFHGLHKNSFNYLGIHFWFITHILFYYWTNRSCSSGSSSSIFIFKINETDTFSNKKYEIQFNMVIKCLSERFNFNQISQLGTVYVFQYRI